MGRIEMDEQEFKNEIKSLKSDISELRSVVEGIHEKIDDRMSFIEEWKNNADIGMKGLEEHGILGYRQKIDRNHIRLEALEKSQERIESQITYWKGWLAGAIVLSGLVSSIVSWLFVNFYYA